MPWGKGVVANNFVFLSGVEARDEKTDFPVLGIKAQTELALNRVKKRLEEAGTSIDNSVKFVWYLADRALEHEFYAARDGWLAKNAPSMLRQRSYASTLLIVGLARYDMLVEVDCIAVLPNSKKIGTARS
jgi:enamine deaminase RidA (YjgF/YER057c/UK114 family)